MFIIRYYYSFTECVQLHAGKGLLKIPSKFRTNRISCRIVRVRVGSGLGVHRRNTVNSHLILALPCVCRDRVVGWVVEGTGYHAIRSDPYLCSTLKYLWVLPSKEITCMLNFLVED